MSGNCRASFSAVSRLSAHHCAARHLGEAGGVVGQRAGGLHAGAERHGDDRQRDQHLDQREAARAGTSPRRAVAARRRRTGRCRRSRASGAGRRGAARCAARRSAARGRARSRARRSPAPTFRRRASASAAARSAARPTKRKPLPSACSASGSQRAATPEARASARADSSRAASRAASCSSLRRRGVAQCQAGDRARDRDERDHDHQLDQREAARPRDALAHRKTAPTGRPLPLGGRGAKRGGSNLVSSLAQRGRGVGWSPPGLPTARSRCRHSCPRRRRRRRRRSCRRRSRLSAPDWRTGTGVSRDRSAACRDRAASSAETGPTVGLATSACRPCSPLG